MASERAKQFMPFASLRGYYEVVRERERVREEKHILSEEDLEIISDKLRMLKRGMMISVRYYDTDCYVTMKGLVAGIDELSHILTVVKTKIKFEDIYDIEIPE